ncbi:uncharacterized protein [Ambystoma mexicanum]|uniref:uncharacterized protein isoform X2 n=1 Tax=Ambystoma mexicanum TaxID=8296 RepID=UPI0037E99D15
MTGLARFAALPRMEGTHNRECRSLPLLCRTCSKVTIYLSTHLTRVCMKGIGAQEIRAKINRSRNETIYNLKNYQLLSFADVAALSEDDATVGKVMEFLEKIGHVVVRRPLPPHNAQSFGNTRSLDVFEEQEGSQDHPEHHTKKSKCSRIHLLRTTGGRNSMQEVTVDTKPYRLCSCFSGFVAHPRKETLQTALPSAGPRVAGSGEEVRACVQRCSFSLDGLGIGKHASVDATYQRYQQELGKKRKTPLRCITILDVAKADVMSTLSSDDSAVTMERACTVVQYLQALLVLKHVQQRAVVMRLKVTEWVNRKHKIIKWDGSERMFALVQHTMSDNQPILIALDGEEEKMCDLYFRKVRPVLLCAGDNRETLHDTSFFISTLGKPIHNPSNDIAYLHKKYGIHSASGLETRAALKKEVNDTGTRQEKVLIKRYLAHTNGNGARQKCFVEERTFCRAAQVLNQIFKRSQGGIATSTVQSKKSLKEQMFMQLLLKFPIGLYTKRPTKNMCSDLAEATDLGSYMYDRWKAAQEKLRAEDIIGNYKRICPAEEQIRSYIKRKGWDGENKILHYVLRKWKARVGCPGSDSERDRKLRAAILQQNWKGLAVLDQSLKGRAVVTTQPFKKGDTICDYHGLLISEQAGEEKQRALTEGNCFLYFFIGKDQKRKCIDGTEERCLCHPGIRNYGRLINHSRRASNVTPKVLSICNAEGLREDVIVFRAARDIEVNEELLLNYGVRRNSFNEGNHLPWLDS